ncbi:DHH family phosphoesterase [Limisalsivibrio acetivorans]|uniref:DHH family phosphoesterase n=1 Tax=Limisalsivibrio acetivorans TaxID=1304888 RepID=UPI0003B469DA|nr:DHH family phosphoesterase [Limisalsivibrio acetivorans]
MIEQILEDIKPYRKVLILTHNNPDPDTISAAAGLKMLLYKKLQKRCTIAYHGIIGRAENRELIKTCKIDMHPSSKLNFARYDYFIVVDTQPTAGNVMIPKGYFPNVVIDHHNFRAQTKRTKIYDIRPKTGSTCTIVTEYMKKLDVIPDANIATALYYGMKTDTFGSGRSNTQHDMDMMAYVFPHISIKKLTKIENPELPKYYFKTMKKAIEEAEILDDLVFCNLGDVRNADLIAETSDFVLRMRDVKWSFVIGRIDDYCFFSLRCKSSRRLVGRIATSIVRGLGTGGGHMKSAGGQISLEKRTYEEAVTEIKKRLLKRIGITGTEPKRI